jgi:prophage antirepressor-like protein
MSQIISNSTEKIFTFQSQNIRVVFINNEPWFVAKDVSELLGFSSKGAISNALKDLDEDERGSFEMNTSGGKQKMIFVSESGLYSLIMRSRKPVAKPFQKWVTKEVLPQIRKTGSYSLSSETSQKISLKEKLELEFVGVKNTIDILRVNQASKIGMIEVIHKKFDLETSYLPKYSDEEHTYSAKALLEKFGVKISVQQFNKLMISAGFLETKTRKSSKYRTEKDENGKEVKIPILKEFKSLTEKGLEFGKNMISPKNQLETQPHYYENRFSQLLRFLGV